jgi:hypothetical protein
VCLRHNTETGWLWKQSRANQAPLKFPVYQGINREFSALLPIFAQTGDEYPRKFNRFPDYSLQKITGNISARTGNLFARTGNEFARSGNVMEIARILDCR